MVRDGSPLSDFLTFDRLLSGLLALVCASLLIGCPQPSVKEIQSEQSRLLDSMESDARTVADPAERQRLLDNIARLRKGMQSSHGTLEAQQRELEALRLERERFQVSRELKAASVEMPFFSPVASAQGLDLWVIPRDARGDAVKVPGTLKVSVRRRGVLGVGTSGKGLADWTLSPSQLQDKWAGQLYQGYHVFLPWRGKERPILRQAVVRVTFTNPDGEFCSVEKAVESGE